MVVASLLYAVCLYRAYGALETLSLYIYYELLILMIFHAVEFTIEVHALLYLKYDYGLYKYQYCTVGIMYV